MCQRVLVGYRLELVAVCVHATMPYMKIPYGCYWRDSSKSLHALVAGIHAEHTYSIFSFFEIIMVLWFNWASEASPTLASQ